MRNWLTVIFLLYLCVHILNEGLDLNLIKILMLYAEFLLNEKKQLQFYHNQSKTILVNNVECKRKSKIQDFIVRPLS